MKTTTTENTAYQNALIIAEKIHEIMGPDFFSIEQMRKQMIINENNRPSKLSWKEARDYIASITTYGFVEPGGKDFFKIRLDEDFRLAYFDKQIDIRNNEIAAYKLLMQTIFDKSNKAEKAQETKPVKPTVKKASAKKVAPKKVAKPVVKPAKNAVKKVAAKKK